MHDNDGNTDSNSNHNRNQKDIKFWLNDQNDNGARGELVPDGFDLKAAKSKTSTTPKDQQSRCPNCGSLCLFPRDRERGLDYYCKRCNERVDPAEPVPDGGRKQCVVCAHPYDREEHDRCPNCEHASLDEFDADGGDDD